MPSSEEDKVLSWDLKLQMEEVLVWVIEEEAVAVVEDNVAKEREMVVVDDDAIRSHYPLRSANPFLPPSLEHGSSNCVGKLLPPNS